MAPKKDSDKQKKEINNEMANLRRSIKKEQSEMDIAMTKFKAEINRREEKIKKSLQRLFELQKEEKYVEALTKHD